MRLSFTLLLLSALAVLVSVALSQPPIDSAASTPPTATTDAAAATPLGTTVNLDVNAVPITEQQAINDTASNATNSISTKPATADVGLSTLLAALDTSHLTAAQRSSTIADELDRMQLLSEQPLSVSERHRLAATMDAWLQLSAEDKLALIRQQQTAFMRAMRAEERRRLAHLVHSMNEQQQARADEQVVVDDDDVSRVRLIRVHPSHVAAAFAASQMDPMVDFAAQQMEAPSTFNLLQMDQHYSVY